MPCVFFVSLTLPLKTPKTVQRGIKSSVDVHEPQKLYLNLLKINSDSDIGDDAGLDNVYDFKFLTTEDAKKRDAEAFWFVIWSPRR